MMISYLRRPFWAINSQCHYRTLVKSLTPFLPVALAAKKISQPYEVLAKKCLDIEVVQAMDFLRVIGNHALHDGQINVKDNREIALRLFKIIDIVAERVITNPKKISELS